MRLIINGQPQVDAAVNDAGTIRNDPDYYNGNYVNQPRALKYARVFYGIATAGGTLNYQKQAPTRELADKIVDSRLAAPVEADANDFLWQWGSSFDYDAGSRA